MADTRRCFWVSLQDMSKKFNEYFIQNLLKLGFNLIIVWHLISGNASENNSNTVRIFLGGLGFSIFQIDFCKQIACIRFFWHSCSNEGRLIWAAFLNSLSPPPFPPFPIVTVSWSPVSFSYSPTSSSYHFFSHPFSHPRTQYLDWSNIPWFLPDFPWLIVFSHQIVHHMLSWSKKFSLRWVLCAFLFRLILPQNLPRSARDFFLWNDQQNFYQHFNTF